MGTTTWLIQGAHRCSANSSVTCAEVLAETVQNRRFTCTVEWIPAARRTVHERCTNPTFSIHSSYLCAKSRFPDLLETLVVRSEGGSCVGSRLTLQLCHQSAHRDAEPALCSARTTRSARLSRMRCPGSASSQHDA